MTASTPNKRYPRSKMSGGKTQTGIGLVNRRNHQLDPEAKEIVIWEDGNPTCLVNLLPEKIATAVRSLTPELLNYSESDHVRKFKISEMAQQIRLAFWDEYFEASDERSRNVHGRNMRVEAIYPRICSREHFYSKMVDTPEVLAFIIKPPKGYMLKMRYMLERAHERFLEILEMPLTNPDGTTDHKVIGNIIKIATLVENRVRGSVAQQVNINSQSLVLNADYEPPKTFQSLEAEIKDVEREILEITGNPSKEVKDALFVETRTEPEVVEEP
jgi:hypothetical protein